MDSFFSTTIIASSTGTCVKRLVTSKLTSLSCGSVSTLRILSTKDLEFLTTCVTFEALKSSALYFGQVGPGWLGSSWLVLEQYLQ